MASPKLAQATKQWPTDRGRVAEARLRALGEAATVLATHPVTPLTIEAAKTREQWSAIAPPSDIAGRDDDEERDGGGEEVAGNGTKELRDQGRTDRTGSLGKESVN